MGIVGRIGWGAAAARQRLLDDQMVRPVAEQRARLAIMAMRLEQAGQVALLRALIGRASRDPRYRLVLQTLLDRAGVRATGASLEPVLDPNRAGSAGGAPDQPPSLTTASP